jgi:hypothetical protein
MQGPKVHLAFHSVGYEFSQPAFARCYVVININYQVVDFQPELPRISNWELTRLATVFRRSSRGQGMATPMTANFRTPHM